MELRERNKSPQRQTNALNIPDEDNDWMGPKSRLKETPIEEHQQCFTYFSSLPAELRRMIWRQAMSRPRMLYLELAECKEPEDRDHFDPYNVSANTVSVRVEGFRMLSKYLRVCRESRNEVLTFQRIHFPCRFRRPYRDTYKETDLGMLYIQPEFDTVFIAFRSERQENFINFLTLARTKFDPQGLGLSYIGVDFQLDCDYSGPPPNNFAAPPESLSIKTAFSDTVAHLREIIFCSNGMGRYLNTYSSLRKTSIRIFVHPRYLPIGVHTANFQFLPRDPRKGVYNPAGAKGHYRVHVVRDPRVHHIQWRDLLKLWGVQHCHAQYSFMPFSLGSVPWDIYTTPGPLPWTSKVIHDRAGVDEWVVTNRHRLEDDYLGDLNQVFSAQSKTQRADAPALTALSQNQESADECSIGTAFGFWIFPLDTIGLLCDSVDQLIGLGQSRDFRLDSPEHGPELALADLH